MAKEQVFKSFQELTGGVGSAHNLLKDSAVVPTYIPAEYFVVREVEAVEVKLPKKSGFMTFAKESVLPNGEELPPHWHNGKPLQGGIFLNVFFYGITEKMLGRRITATIKVIKKKTESGREYTMLDVFCTPAIAPIYEIKFHPGKTGGEDVIPVLNSEAEIEFRSIKSKEKRE